MANIEILAPVGSEEMLHAAVFSGADAVYLGFSGFNARTGAGNFDADSLKEAVRFCHARGVKVHVALEHHRVRRGTGRSARCHPGGGRQRGGRGHLPGSGRGHPHREDRTPAAPPWLHPDECPHPAGALELKELGFTRVVLARELSLPEVEQITRHCGIETECFVHGALCMCVSGQCYLSAFGRTERQPRLLCRPLPPAL